MRNHAFDAAKGFLILLVILGHVLLGSISGNLGREIIYFFHMPVFLAITGYFISEKVLSSSVASIFSKYKNRLILPFVLAFVVYTTLELFMAGSWSVKQTVKLFLYPFYHLWYIPAILIFIVYAKIVDSLRVKHTYLFYVACAISIFTTMFFESYGQDISLNVVFRMFGDKRYYYFFSYFYLGCLLSKNRREMPFDILVLSFVVSIVVYGYSRYEFVAGVAKFLANVSLICLIISALQSGIGYRSLFLSKIGVVSLPIYLWHVLPLIALKNMNFSDSYYYVFCFIFFACFVGLVVLLRGRFTILDRYFYGA